MVGSVSLVYSLTLFDVQSQGRLDLADQAQPGDLDIFRKEGFDF